MKKKTLIIGLLLLVITLGITYAWWNWTSSNTNVTFTIEGATITYNAGNNISGIKLIPVSSKEKGETDGTGVAKTITASANKTSYLTLNLDLVTFPSNLADASINSSKEISDDSLVSSSLYSLKLSGSLVK